MASDLIPEEWRAVEGWPYEVSDLGRVRRTAAPAGRTRAGRILTPCLYRAGCKYWRVTLSRGGLAKTFRVHRLVAVAFIGPPPSKRHGVAHTDGNPANNAAANLRWATAKENEADKRTHGTNLVGTKVSGHRLDNESVSAIRKLRADGHTTVSLAEVFNVHQTTISLAAIGRTWRHVP